MRTSKLVMVAAAFAAVLMSSHAAMAQFGPYSGLGFSSATTGDSVPYTDIAYSKMRQPPVPMADAPAPLGAGVAANGSGGYSCSDSIGCATGVPSYGCNDCCCPGWAHRFNVFGEFLYLRPRDAEVAYASIIEGPIAPGVAGLQAGPTGVLDYDYQPGFRLGAGIVLDSFNAIQVQYSQLDATSTDVTATAAPNVVRALVDHPNALNAGANWLDAAAEGDLRFQMIDASYCGLLSYSCDYEVSYLVGVRYARFEQAFGANFTNVGTEAIRAAVDFDGVGARFGMDAIRYGNNRQWFVYGKGYTSLIGGRFENSYLQSNQADPVVATTTWEAGRVVTMLDLEAGIGWQNSSGNIRGSIGYMYSGWFNTIRMNEWIRAVQNNDFVATGMSTYDSGVTFDGLTARVELLW